MPLRAPLAVINEQSLPPVVGALAAREVLEILAAFVEVARALQKIRPDIGLAAAAPLGGLPLTTGGLGFAAIAEMSGGIAKEHWRYIQSRRNIAPFGASPDLQVPDLDEEFTVGGKACAGLGVAASSGQLAVSFQTDESWDADVVELARVRLLEDDATGDVIEERAVVVVRHASTPIHAQTHGQFVANMALPDPFSGADLWADRGLRYPSLQFLPRVEDQLTALGHGSVAVWQVHNRLSELNEAAAEWDPVGSTFPAWRSNVTPEGEQRKQLRMFIDDDGETRCFDLHARFTPGAGRIHFRLVPEAHALRIAHIGRKIGA